MHKNLKVKQMGFLDAVREMFETLHDNNRCWTSHIHTRFGDLDPFYVTGEFGKKLKVILSRFECKSTEFLLFLFHNYLYLFTKIVIFFSVIIMPEIIFVY